MNVPKIFGKIFVDCNHKTNRFMEFIDFFGKFNMYIIFLCFQINDRVKYVTQFQLFHLDLWYPVI